MSVNLIYLISFVKYYYMNDYYIFINFIIYLIMRIQKIKKYSRCNQCFNNCVCPNYFFYQKKKKSPYFSKKKPLYMPAPGTLLELSRFIHILTNKTLSLHNKTKNKNKNKTNLFRFYLYTNILCIQWIGARKWKMFWVVFCYLCSSVIFVLILLLLWGAF